jgi:hypothetical protein
MDVCCECRVLSGRGLCDELITRPEESYRLWCVVVCDLETSWIRRPWPALGRSATEKKGWILLIMLWAMCWSEAGNILILLGTARPAKCWHCSWMCTTERFAGYHLYSWLCRWKTGQIIDVFIKRRCYRNAVGRSDTGMQNDFNGQRSARIVYFTQLVKKTEGLFSFS